MPAAKPLIPDLAKVFANPATTLAGVPTGFDGKVIADLLRLAATRGIGRLAVLARDGGRLSEIETAVRYFAPDTAILNFPAWDCMPYDRVSPHGPIVARRMATLAVLAEPPAPRGRAVLVLTTVNAAIQRVPGPRDVAGAALLIKPGDRIAIDWIVGWLAGHGFSRSSTVREPGEFAVRGGIVDLFPAGLAEPARLDFFGDTLESIRRFSPDSQRTTGEEARLELVPTSELVLGPAAIARFRQDYVSLFGAADRADLLYQAVSEGRRAPGMEHWLPLFLPDLGTLFDYLPSAPWIVDHLADQAVAERLAEIKDHYDARVAAEGGGQGQIPYRPLPPDRLYLAPAEWRDRLGERPVIRLSPFVPDGAGVIDLSGRQGRTFAAERTMEGANVFDAVIAHATRLRAAGKQVIVAAWSDGSLDRLSQVLTDRGLAGQAVARDWPAAARLPRDIVAFSALPLETGFETADLAVIGEQDILGDRLVRPRRRTSRGSDYLREINSLLPGDLVVHVDHGIGKFKGLVTISAAGTPRDCLELTYAGGDRLYLPVENIELLSRYGSEESDTPLDRLGGVAWQSRRARMKKRIRDMAAQLIKVAAARLLKSAPVLLPPEGAFDEFAARFPYEETDDQMMAIEAVIGDLAAGRPMDRLICGDVGFGKTEIALRAAFVAALNGRQVAVVVPTTLLARQHAKTFRDRFAAFPVKVGHLSRLVPAQEAATVRAGLADGTIDIAIGTHALLAAGTKFRDLGLLVIDEEQHFGVRHKERLKEVGADVHVLTLTATPIPRTLQLALTGVRELSMITTPPIDRLAVRTFVSPFDPLTVREAILRERYRGGQAFYVCPKIADLADAKAFLDEHIPEVRVAVAHGQLPPGELDDVMSAFYDGAYDVLLSTSIIESGLDIPTANTLIVHRAQLFGLGQLYQLRGRIGRSKTRAYALFTVPADGTLTPNAERRLKVLQSLDTLGAGFQLASHDLDIRGAGNLLGEEQSGHIKEVGYELYQQMLEEAVASLKEGGPESEEGQWSPQITIGAPLMIPETYVPDLHLRMTLYRRLAEMTDAASIDAFAAELIDRFGPLPSEVEHLLKVLLIKSLCRIAHVEKLDAGPRGAVISLRDNIFPNPAALVGWIAKEGSLAKIRPDQKIVLIRDWEAPERRLAGAAVLMNQLARLAAPAGKAAA